MPIAYLRPGIAVDIREGLLKFGKLSQPSEREPTLIRDSGACRSKSAHCAIAQTVEHFRGKRIPAFAASIAACTVACVPDGQSHLQKLQLKTAKVAKTASQPAKTTVVSLQNSAFL
jgi:hypothetical protein